MYYTEQKPKKKMGEAWEWGYICTKSAYTVYIEQTSFQGSKTYAPHEDVSCTNSPSSDIEEWVTIFYGLLYTIL